MAAKNKLEVVETYPETITIVAEPSFGSAIKFLLFGAAIGAGAMFYFRKPGAPAAEEYVPLPAQGTRSEQLNDRVHTLAARVKNLSGKASSAAKLASKAVTPAIKNAVAEGKRAARETRESIEDDLETESDTKYAEEGEKLQAEREAEAQRLGIDIK